jgi:hypothetical protein
MNAAIINEPRVTPSQRCNQICAGGERRCAECPRVFTSSAQYMASRGSIICRDGRGCAERAAAARSAKRAARVGGAR